MRKRGHRMRIYVVGVAFVLAAIVLWARLVQVQYVRHDAYAALALEQGSELREISPVRGGIFDRSGKPLALSGRLCSVAIKPREVKNRHRVTAAIINALGVSRREVREKLRSGRRFVYVRRQCHLDRETREKLSSLGGVVVEREAGRIYPFGSLAAKIVGSVGVDNRGLWGTEVALDKELRGEPGQERVIKNGRYREDRYYRFVLEEPRDGKHVYLTIDVTVQEIAENEIARAVRTHAARSGIIIIMEVGTGDVLALAEYPAIANRRWSANGCHNQDLTIVRIDRDRGEAGRRLAVGAGALFIAVFLACAVEAVEATTIVLAAGTARDWQ
ncbi:MAG: hypothetical protein IH969_08255, partial [Candidatus Krumholzibacteriota bacterium]|nr:hypothetical protein [Candidatus Krumholzibacteriota bacterium]